MRRLWFAVLAGVAGLVIWPGVAFAAPGDTPSVAPSGSQAPAPTTGSRIESIIFPLVLVALLIGYAMMQRKRRQERETRYGTPTPAELRAQGPLGGISNFGGMRLREYIAEEERRREQEMEPRPEPADPRQLPGEAPPRGR